MRFLPTSNKNTMKFLAIAVTLMVLVNFFVFDKHGYHDDIKAEYYAEQAKIEAQKFDPVAESVYTKNPPKIVYPEEGVYFEAEPVDQEAIGAPEAVSDEPEAIEPDIVKPQAIAEPTVRYNGKGGKIAIVIDDVGMNGKWSKAAIDLPSAVTLAFLPYANKVAEQAREAKSQGHEIIIHMPMEAMNADVDLGAMALRTNMSKREFQTEFDLMTQQLEGFVGINNHMGSKLTQDVASMEMLMTQLKTRRLYFLDSRTIHTSIAAEMAQNFGVPYAVRDVFLDHEDTSAFVEKALQDVERIASEHGQAIAIGHPKKHTMKALQKWLPTLKARGFEVVPLSDLLVHPEKKIPKAAKANEGNKSTERTYIYKATPPVDSASAIY